jgi:glucosamine kinase
VSTAATGTCLVADVGKTGCRVRLVRGGVDPVERTGAGTVGLARPDGPADVAGKVVAALGTDLVASAAGGHGCVATAGQVARDQGAALAGLLIWELELARCAVTSDAVAAHVGALDGRPGVVLTIGTGVAAVGLSPAGDLHVVDGVGQWLGDEGSGAWIGLEGLRAAVRASDGRGPGTELTGAAADLFGPVSRLPLTLEQSGNVPREAARFAPRVAALAASDSTAADIIERAAQALARTVIAAARRTGTDEVAVVGGLVGLGPSLLDPWRAAVAGGGVRVVEPVGTALDGAARLCADESLPHEQLVFRTGG